MSDLSFPFSVKFYVECLSLAACNAAVVSSQICCLKGQRGMCSQPTFDGIHLVNHFGGDDESYQSSDEDGARDPSLQKLEQRSGAGAGRVRLRPNLPDTDSDEDDSEALRLSIPASSNHKSTTV